MMNYNRFDLEQHILKCWNITDDIDVLYRAMCDTEMDKDKIANILLGMKQLYDFKFDILFNCFEELVNEKKIT
jgi:hypothetical protein